MNILISAIICFFAVYGLIQMVSKWADEFLKINEARVGSPYIVFTVKNQQDSIEGVIRSIVWKALSRNGGRQINDIVVIDLGSEDETPRILSKLENEYEFIHVMNKESYIEMVNEF